MSAATDRTPTAPSAPSYSPALIALHWTTVLVLVVLFTAIELREYYPKGSDTRRLLMATHMSSGILILLLTLLRITIRSRSAAPPIIPAPPAWQDAIARAIHLTLYAAMIAMPLLGWVMTSAGGHGVPFFGLTLPPLIGENKELGHTLEDVHEFIGNALYYIIGLHALAALAHHYAFRDNTLSRMLPIRR